MRNLIVLFVLAVIVGAFALFVGSAPEATPQILQAQGVTLEKQVPSSQAEIALSFAPVVKKAVPAVVNIFAQTSAKSKRVARQTDILLRQFIGRSRGDQSSEEFFGDKRRNDQQSLGSGVIATPDGLVVTNAHVVEDALNITAVLSDRREYRADVLIEDVEADIAVLKLRDVREVLPTLPFGDSDALEVGDLVLAIGNPFGVGQTVTSGIVSAEVRSGSRGRTFIQTDAAINPGNSGGALVDMTGRLVGVNSAILTRSGGSNGIGFAIPVDLVEQAVAQAETGADRLSRPWLGVDGQAIDAVIAETLGLARPQGILLTSVEIDSPFGRAGLRPGAVLLSLDDQPIDDLAELNFRLEALGVGAIASVETLTTRGRRVHQIQLSAAPEAPTRVDYALTQLSGRFDLSGATVANLDAALVEEIALVVGDELASALPTSGVIVLTLTGHAKRVGLMPGDVIRRYNKTKINQVSDLVDVVRREPRARRFIVLRGGQDVLVRYGR